MESKNSSELYDTLSTVVVNMTGTRQTKKRICGANIY